MTRVSVSDYLSLLHDPLVARGGRRQQVTQVGSRGESQRPKPGLLVPSRKLEALRRRTGATVPLHARRGRLCHAERRRRAPGLG